CGGGGDRGDPVEAVDDHEQDHAGVHLVRQQPRQQQETHAAEAVVGDQELARVGLVGQPSGGDGAGDVEHAHDGQEARRGGGGHAVIVGGGDEVDADQPVGGRSADGERDRQRPELPPSGRVREPFEGACDRAAGGAGRRDVGGRV